MTRNRLRLCLILLLGCALMAASCAMPRIAVHDDPLSGREHLKLGMAYEAKGETERAMSEYGMALRSEPLARLYMGNILFGQGKLAEAEVEYRAALERLPDNPEVMNNLAWLLLKRKHNLEEAQTLAERAVSRAPSKSALSAYKDTLKAIRAARAAAK
ncbi:MAG: tetratricopeptide repeat protein [Humidesulfovibrio sp.]|jgi:Tfp pilus assembly protein PilF|uniref:tetratricopeptide repeat protein n=1 Tax=Humidesulfovibrio sp. TaxID=2910988 RepID=UPI002735E6BC|nr:tetratricopeptide repeat protein [Humidesulfovibrio sp.]MDP2849383.1 tetratricopeptide repeat protein [Humidesulfovibrio sp.]